MPNIEEIEPILRDSVEEAIDNGYLILAKDWGIAWDASTGRWTRDLEQPHVCGCCVVGAHLLMKQPPVDPELHKGDPYEAAMLALGCDRWWLRDFMNGCDGWPSHSGNEPEVYDLGLAFRNQYRAMDIEILRPLYEPHSETRLKILPSLDSESELFEPSKIASAK